MFQHMYWVTLAVVYITVQSTISIFNFGFILWCFFFLWHGQALYLQPRTRLFRLWKIFIGYNYLTLLAKVCLQVLQFRLRLQTKTKNQKKLSTVLAGPSVITYKCRIDYQYIRSVYFFLKCSLELSDATHSLLWLLLENKDVNA